MSTEDLQSLPGAEIVLPGIADLEAGRRSVNAIAIQCAATDCVGSASTHLASRVTSPRLISSTRS